MAYGGSIGHVTVDVTWPRKVKVVTQTYLDANISKTVEDRDSVPMEHQYEMAYGGSIGHVTGDVMWTWMVKVVAIYIWIDKSWKALELALDRLRVLWTLGPRPILLGILI